MQVSASRVTTIEQLYATAGAMTAPVLLHVDGAIEWANRSFLQRFGVNEEALGGARVRDLLWCLGIPEAVAGMIAEGASFGHCIIPGENPKDSHLTIRQQGLTMQPDGRRRLMLVLADEFDPPTEGLTIGDQ
jgi:PAS domain-containing protein